MKTQKLDCVRLIKKYSQEGKMEEKVEVRGGSYTGAEISGQLIRGRPGGAAVPMGFSR